MPKNRPAVLFLAAAVIYWGKLLAILSPPDHANSPFEKIMDNVTRSERSRKAAIQAALTIITRDGPARLTLDAIARECGMSKGGVMHQFPTKEEVLRALLDHQVEYFENVAQRFLAGRGDDLPEPRMAAQLATIRQSIAEPDALAPAVIGVFAGQPGLMSGILEGTIEKLSAVRGEAADPDLACLRWAAAMGLALSSMLGICPFSEKERGRLFDRLADHAQWAALEKADHKPSNPSSVGRKGKGRTVRRSAAPVAQEASVPPEPPGGHLTGGTLFVSTK